MRDATRTLRRSEPTCGHPVVAVAAVRHRAVHTSSVGDARAAFDDGVRRGQSRETTAYYDDLFRHIARRAHADTNDDEWRTKIKSDCGALS